MGHYTSALRLAAAGTRRLRRSWEGALWLALWVTVFVPLVGGPPAAWAQDELFVANFDDNSVTVYSRTASGNTAPLRTLARAATGVSGPSRVAVDLVNNELVVANQGTGPGTGNSITVYSLTASGNTAPLRTLQGAATGLFLPVGLAVDSANNELVVTNFSNSVTVYSRTASGNTAPLRTLQGSATGLRDPEGVAVDSANNELVVTNFDTNSVTVYSRTASGNTAPLRTLQGSATAQSATGLDSPGGVAVDSANNELVVANRGTQSITVYSRTASGNAAPLRTLQGAAATGLIGLANVAVDSVNNELAVVYASSGAIAVFSRTASGNAAPLRTLQGAATGLNSPLGLAVTTGPPAAAKELFVVNLVSQSVTVYARTASGNVAPLRTLQGAATGLIAPVGVAVDLANNELVVADFGDSVTVYARTASGNTAPLRTLQGGATGLREPAGVAVDSANNELVVANGLTNSVTVYSRTANGNVAPLRTLQGGATGLIAPDGVAVDLANNELVVANSSNNSVTVYSRTANGDTPPVRTLQGAATGLHFPDGVAVDLANNELVVANSSNNSVTVYSRTADGNIAPLRVLQGAATGLNSPRGVAVDSANNELVVANGLTNSVTVYSRVASGNTAPLRTLQGTATGLSSPGFLAVTTSAFPAAAVSLNGSVFQTGRRITYQATLTPGPPPPPTPVDIYLGALLPDGVTFLSIIAQPSGVSAVVGFSPVPFRANTTIISKEVVTFSHTFIGFEPAGTYFAYAGFAVAGSNPFQAANVLSLGVQGFQFMP